VELNGVLDEKPRTGLAGVLCTGFLLTLRGRKCIIPVGCYILLQYACRIGARSIQYTIRRGRPDYGRLAPCATTRTRREPRRPVRRLLPADNADHRFQAAAITRHVLKWLLALGHRTPKREPQVLRHQRLAWRLWTGDTRWPADPTSRDRP